MFTKIFAITTVLGATSLCAPSLHAEGSLQIDQALSEALIHSPKVQKAQAASEEFRWKHNSAYAGFLPHVAVSANHFFSKRFQLLDVNLGPAPIEFPEVYPTTSYTLDVTLPLFDGLANVRQFQGTALLASAAEDEESFAGFQVEQDIRLKFYQALAAVELRAVAAQNVKTVEDHLKRVQVLRRGGEATNYDILRIEVQLDEARAEAMAAEDNVVLARNRLAETMGLEHDERSLSGELVAPDATKVAALSSTVLGERKDIRAMQKRSEAAAKKESAERAFWIPKFGLGAEYQIYNNVNNSFSDSTAFRAAYNFGIFLSWNIFDGGALYSEARQAAAQLAQSERALRMAELHVPNDFDFWKRRYVYSASLYGAKKSDVAKANESVRLALEGFRAGTRTTSETLDAELELFRAKAGVINSQVNALEALVNLELALGRRI